MEGPQLFAHHDDDRQAILEECLQYFGEGRVEFERRVLLRSANCAVASIAELALSGRGGATNHRR